jgi:hypothetical protein
MHTIFEVKKYGNNLRIPNQLKLPLSVKLGILKLYQSMTLLHNKMSFCVPICAWHRTALNSFQTR